MSLVILQNGRAMVRSESVVGVKTGNNDRMMYLHIHLANSSSLCLEYPIDDAELLTNDLTQIGEAIDELAVVEFAKKQAEGKASEAEEMTDSLLSGFSE